MSTVWFMVDDTDPRLSYSGSWSFIPNTNNFSANSFDQSSRTGPAFNSTLHSTTGNVTVSFRFNGSSYLGVYGTLDGTRPNGVLPEINCLLDGGITWSFGNPSPEGLTNNNMLACRADSRIGGSSPGEHELLINVTNSADSAWYFDYITYESLANPTIDGEVLQAGNAELIDATNYSMLTFGAGWTLNSDDSSVTKIPGSQATVKFNGTSVSLYGDFLSNVSNTAAYQVDDHAPVTFQLPGQIGSTISSKQVLFTASDLSVGEHTLVVAFNGSQSGMPLDVDYFYVQSLTSAQQASLSSSSSTSTSAASTSTGSASSTSSGHINSGVIAGAVLGSVIPIILVLLALTWYWRKSRRKKALLAVTPFDHLDDHDLITAPLTTEDLASASSNRLEDTFTSYSSTKRPPEEMVLTPLRAGDISLHTGSASASDSSKEGPPATSGNRPSANLLTMKLEQRLAIMQEQIHQRDQQLAEGSTQREGMFTVHTDSGLRLTGEDALRLNHNMAPIEVPPGYTAD
ncbi:hypothetical protein GYMLUDRAFT_72528 [Collybiopsis luxurians FD-317 M1]|uniref:Uncharacterized protein n=1 Tax=Collybiopsis luxurians FD-317 M1 TaxID=944289 RepID=A0A0D0BFU6_9AGAR|nr:hypothetical protein GYMLUDRAFT_72528 [Collybiopsis luxurians FD-317 M1]